MQSRSDASCGTAACPINAQRFLKPGSLQLGYVFEYINQDQIYVGSIKAFVGAVPQHHDEVQTLNMSSALQLYYGATDILSFGVELPFIHREHSHIHHHQGQDVWESWNFNGLGDLRINSQLDLTLASEPNRHLTVLAGLKLPTGVRNAKNAEGEEAEVTLQPGSGSLDGMIGFNYNEELFSVPMLTGQYSVLPLTVGVKYQFNGKGTDDWRFGNSLIASLGTAYQFVTHASFLLQVNGRFQQFADIGATGNQRKIQAGHGYLLVPA